MSNVQTGHWGVCESPAYGATTLSYTSVCNASTRYYDLSPTTRVSRFSARAAVLGQGAAVELDIGHWTFAEIAGEVTAKGSVRATGRLARQATVCLSNANLSG